MNSGKEELYLKAKDAYYNAQPIMSDMEFDDLEMEIKTEMPHSPVLRMVGSKIRGGVKVQHTSPMLSMDKALTVPDLLAWVDSRRNSTSVQRLVATPKLDGMSCELRYAQGYLAQAVSRGDGEEGEDITAKVRHFVPNKLQFPADAVIRGELTLSFKDLEEVNLLLEEPLANPRNGVVGLMMEEALSPQKLKHVKFVGFEVLSYSTRVQDETIISVYEFYAEELRHMKEIGIEPVDFIEVDFDTVNLAVDFWKAARNEAEIPWDGVVFRLAHNEDGRKLGRTSKFWKRATAWKFEADVALVIPTKIVWSAGTREYTPVVHFNPVLLDGAVIRKSGGKSIHNMAKLGILIGEEVELRRSGGVIPWLQPTGKVDEKQALAYCLSTVPLVCPKCASGMLISHDYKHVNCENSNCEGKLARQLEILAKALGIKTMGPAMATELVESKAVESLADLFNVVSPARLVEEIQESLTRSHKPWKILGSVGVKRMGESSAQKLITYLGSIEAATLATAEELKAALGIKDDELATAISDSLNEVSNEVKSIINAGISLQELNTQGYQSPLPEGKTNVVVTGDLDGMSREEFQALLEEKGIKLGSTVSTRTAYLVTNDNTTQTSKARKAKQLNVPIVDQTTIVALLGLHKE